MPLPDKSEQSTYMLRLTTHAIEREKRLAALERRKTGLIDSTPYFAAVQAANERRRITRAVLADAVDTREANKAAVAAANKAEAEKAADAKAHRQKLVADATLRRDTKLKNIATQQTILTFLKRLQQLITDSLNSAHQKHSIILECMPIIEQINTIADTTFSADIKKVNEFLQSVDLQQALDSCNQLIMLSSGIVAELRDETGQMLLNRVQAPSVEELSRRLAEERRASKRRQRDTENSDSDAEDSNIMQFQQWRRMRARAASNTMTILDFDSDTDTRPTRRPSPNI